MKTAAIVIVILAIIGGGAVAISKHSNNNTAGQSATSQTQSSTSSQSQSSSTTVTTGQNSAATITYSDSGFSPGNVTVKVASTVTIKNTSSGPLQFDSDPHPAHTDDPELNVGIVEPGQSMTFTVNVKGTHGYHNHLDASQKGTIIAE
jgi:plastocyanin